MTIWVLGDQLTTEVGPLATTDPGADSVLMIEAHGFARRMPYHAQKLTLVFSAMRHVRDRLRAQGYEVDYRQVETFGKGLTEHFAASPDDELVLMEPASHGAADRFRELVAEAGGDLEVVKNELFLCSKARFDDWAGDRESFKHEGFYRMMRRETGYLMDGDDPEGGEWNYDDENREFPRPEVRFPDPPSFEPDEITQEVQAWVADEFETWGDGEGFAWPVTRTQALAARDDFIENRLPQFGPYQDAMLRRSWSLNHALLAPALNLGLLTPQELVEPAIEAYENGDAPLPSVEGFVRQVLGWREFVRHVYRNAMPDLADANQLGHEHDLPEAYYTGETDMRCLSECVGHVWDHGYAHHIERLMVLSNFATLYGADPQELNRWFHFGFADAYHWVTTPNVVGMGSFASDVLSTKPYVSSANYVDKMSDYCADCPYDEDATTGEDACPFNALYWEFLDRHEDTLRSNHRMSLLYSHVDRKSADELAAIRERAAEVREMGADGTL
ncbi:cryptochrome/photolyase family protein [Haloarchaeobius sp. HME9146]|uniref:cryptochrome/photolyase family protein n=1 Tax=Haloarchaeobius sp. HME9146 TaxID=2978732 RepID=UPI0021BFCB77|nr:cryptochrome/photolyase family protein [Haloarchaeobius sp. HME9146]MCT9096766.1 cryptochrome/photolyase family protein [Haloarchaeobius sp. HME9146]